MHYRRIAAFLLGTWLAGSVFMTFVATGNFGTVDTVLKSAEPPLSNMIQTLGKENARLFLRHLAGEENRSYFQTWEIAQFIVGVLLTGLLWIKVANRLLAGLSGAMLILVLFVHFKVTPEIAWLGRSIEFIPGTAESQARNQFWRLHTLYGVIELVKLLLGVLIAGFLFTMRRRGRARVDVDAVDYSDHRHVNR